MVARALGRESGRVLEPPKPMREQQQNPSTPELHQPLLFAPSELLACGLRDAHHHPLVGVRTEDGVRSWRTAAGAGVGASPGRVGTHGHRVEFCVLQTSSE